ncbi:hypothetical protein [Gimibacter soli]|uniref:Solute-binding protein family 3/N-terminal domain-containing protein n=1 Tax=Gimibacter soli TaxID=3024400 RepID=A0AAF0BHN1_9PROT|nr:hypothetical protein [Gimibacter soli]WCL54433.1 hypothetical protein PH603_01505 [Gimibacter soli]
MRHLLILILLLAPAFTGRAAVADDRPLAQWYYVDVPPAMILEGDGKGTGYVDRIIALFKRSMPGYRHEDVASSVVRMFATMQVRDGICTGGLLRTPERENVLVYSDSFYPVLVNRLVTIRAKRPMLAPYLGADNHVDLMALAADKRLVAGYVGQRFYSTLIQRFIEERTESDPEGRLRVLIPNDRFSDLLRHDRIDFAFGLAAEIYYQSLNGDAAVPGGELVSFAVKGEPITKPGGFACSGGPLGRQMADEMNRLIADPAIRAEIHGYYTDWLDEDARRDFEAAVREEETR